MPKGKNQKFKLYRLAQIMLENTDEEHYITMPEIKEKLEEYEVTADRKSIYNDFNLLRIILCQDLFHCSTFYNQILFVVFSVSVYKCLFVIFVEELFITK